MERTLQVINELEREGIIKRYAIGGAMGALFYSEPLTTFDLDLFCELEINDSGLVVLTTIYDALSQRGYQPAGEAVLIEGIPVQFLPVDDDLLGEALDEAQWKAYGTTMVRVFRVEHLIAIALKTGRNKDRDRVGRLLDETEHDQEYLEQVILRHNLLVRWMQWQ